MSRRTQAANGAAPRTLLVDAPTFAWLRQLQASAPQPRVDMRYLLEGMLAVIRGHAECEPEWLLASREALISHVAREAGRPAAADTTQRRSLTNAARSPQGPITQAGTADDAVGEGANARTTGPGLTRRDDCKALQLGDAGYQWLKAIQATTHEPRLDFRFLLSGASALLSQRPDLLPEVVARARQALSEHLRQLETTPVPHFSMETQK